MSAYRHQRLVLAPLAVLEMEYPFTLKWGLTADVSGMDLSGDRLVDAGVALRYRFNRTWDASLGYRYYDRAVDSSAFTNDVQYDFVTLGVGYSF